MPGPSSSSAAAVLTLEGTALPDDARPWTDQERAYAEHLRWLSSSRYVDFPYQIGIESRAVCNARCDFCAYPTMKRRGDRMDDALLEKILREMEDLPRDLPLDVNLSRMNEPFADKRVPELAAELERRFPQVSLWFFTNASPLTARVLDRLAGLGRVSQFVISFNDHRAEEYERVMGLGFERTVANIDNLHSMVESGAARFTPTVSRVGDGSAADAEFLDFVRARWPRFIHRVTQRFDWIGGKWGGDITRFGDIPRAGCWQWFHLPILAGGKVANCSIDYEGALAWGDARQTHILEIYNQPARRALRERVPLRHAVPDCAACNHFG